MIYENGKVNLQSALNRLVDIGIQNPNKLMEYTQNPPSFLGDQAGLLINMAANIVGTKRQEAQTAPPPTATVKDQNIAKLAQTTQPGIGAINPMMAMQQQDMMQRAQPMEEPTPEMMAQGGLAELDTGDMFNEQNYAGGGIVAFGGQDGSYVEGRDYPDYTAEEEPTSFFDRTFGRYFDREREMALADDAIEKYKLEKGVMPWTKQKKSEIDAYDKGLAELEQKRKEAGRSIFSGKKTLIAPTVDVTPDKNKTDNKAAETQVKRDKANENALKKANDDYLNSLKQSNAEQISSYDQAMQRMMDLAKNDPYRQQLRDEYDKEKSGAFYDVLGDIGIALAGAKKGQEGLALQQGFTSASGRVKDLRKQKRDLMLAEQKADRDYQMLGAKYGFDSEQARAALAAKERMAEAELKNKLETANIMSGGRQRALDLKATQNYQKAWNDWTKSPEGMNTMLLASRKPTGDKQQDAQIIAAKQKIENERNRIRIESGAPDMSPMSSGSQLPAGMTMERYNELRSMYNF